MSLFCARLSWSLAFCSDPHLTPTPAGEGQGGGESSTKFHSDTTPQPARKHSALTLGSLTLTFMWQRWGRPGAPAGLHGLAR